MRGEFTIGRITAVTGATEETIEEQSRMVGKSGTIKYTVLAAFSETKHEYVDVIPFRLVDDFYDVIAWEVDQPVLIGRISQGGRFRIMILEQEQIVIGPCSS